jgi:hypothetical protein
MRMILHFITILGALPQIACPSSMFGWSAGGKYAIDSSTAMAPDE